MRHEEQNQQRGWTQIDDLNQTQRISVYRTEQMALQTMYHNCRGENVNFKEIGKIVNSDQIIFVVEFKQIYITFFPRPSTFSMLLQRFLKSYMDWSVVTRHNCRRAVRVVIAHTEPELVSQTPRSILS